MKLSKPVLAGISLLAIAMSLALQTAKVEEPSFATDAANEVVGAVPTLGFASADATDALATVSNASTSIEDLNRTAPSNSKRRAQSASPRAVPQTEREKQTVSTLSALLFDSSREGATPAELVKHLANAGYQPIASRDSDELTGSMIVVETKNALPGSRYFRAQFFSDEDGNYEAQHVSFELRPGTKIATVIAALNSSFGQLGKPTFQNKEWTSWKAEGRPTISIKQITKADILEGNAIKARSAEDEGAYWVMFERPLGGHEHEAM